VTEEAVRDDSDAKTPFETRRDALQARVNTAALALHERNVRPTVTRIRAALGGGSPNELAPALRQWKERVLPTLVAGKDPESASGVPPLISDLVHELWSRAVAAAVVEVKGGSAARQVVARTEEAQALRNQVASLRDQLQRESLAFGELGALAARHAAIARDALERVREGETRERKLLHELGDARQRVGELTATIREVRARRAEEAPRVDQRKLASAKRHLGKAKRPRPKTKAVATSRMRARRRR
jgi:Plasmid replication region DNA-binding N-term